jgi:hypothetical protein
MTGAAGRFSRWESVWPKSSDTSVRTCTRNGSAAVEVVTTHRRAAIMGMEGMAMVETVTSRAGDLTMI